MGSCKDRNDNNGGKAATEFTYADPAHSKAYALKLKNGGVLTMFPQGGYERHPGRTAQRQPGTFGGVLGVADVKGGEGCGFSTQSPTSGLLL